MPIIIVCKSKSLKLWHGLSQDNNWAFENERNFVADSAAVLLESKLKIEKHWYIWKCFQFLWTVEWRPFKWQAWIIQKKNNLCSHKLDPYFSHFSRSERFTFVSNLDVGFSCHYFAIGKSRLKYKTDSGKVDRSIKLILVK